MAENTDVGANKDGKHVSEEKRPVYDLSKFDEDITNYQNILAEISKLRSLVDIGWVRYAVGWLRRIVGMHGHLGSAGQTAERLRR